MWWVGVAVGLVILVLGIRAAFLGGMKPEPEITPVDNGPTPTLESDEAAPSELTDTLTPLEPTDTSTPPQGEAATGDCSSEDVFCVGLVTDVGEVDDKSFNQSAWEGVQQAGTELGAKVEYLETKDAKDYGANIDLFAGQNYDVIVTVGFAVGEATGAAAAKYPEIDFIGVDQFQGAAVEQLRWPHLP